MLCHEMCQMAQSAGTGWHSVPWPKLGAGGGDRTRMPYRPQILSLLCLPFHHARMSTLLKRSQYLQQGIGRKMRVALGHGGVLVPELELSQL